MHLIQPTHWQSLEEHTAIILNQQYVLLHTASRTPLLNFQEAITYPDLTVERVYLDGDLLLVCASAPTQSANGFEWTIAKQWLNHSSERETRYLLRACHWLTWDRRHAHCSSCGHSLEKVVAVLEKHCDNCGATFYPNLAPAIIVGIQKEDSILLARGPHFPQGVYSVLAGFIDAGESAEDAVRREVREEVGIAVDNIRYVGTQSWPFPGSFMIAYLADYAGGTIRIDDDEIEDAQWFQKDNLPTLPVKASLSRRLIDLLMGD